MKNFYHTGVLVDQAIAGLNVFPKEKYIDATIGGGDHTAKIMELGGIVLGLDQDVNAIKYCQKRFGHQLQKKQLTLVHTNFEKIDEVAKARDFVNVSGILYDLGISSFQMEDPTRGFSFRFKDAPLDMRMGEQTGVKACDLLNALPQKALEEIFFKYGNIREAKKLVQEIIRARTNQRFVTVGDLLTTLMRIKKDFTRDDFAAKVFLSLRIAVNLELEVLSQSLPKAQSLLDKDGRLAVISFQGLEDGVVKNFGRGASSTLVSLSVPMRCEIIANPRSRSAKLRVYRFRGSKNEIAKK
ncbi:16S rRNA (cytosine(1402)-N(4))-methyltransferase RsmH [Candidatus Parcubacteria bacterium]|nr:16S rRNA (cytosine(1402)-N(4))-methyltransferase RsmH [Patescibacteria group bacterium]MBU4380743.1 16S rRNA (cytosine(1402)-N(4))-methyltransferase RsmH [Patescibacteria group bacterium]MCG2688825.1 16S rRNA (cytosine(1402)-N(4))-methyltransferase RsmH [Candidatus Parcubacteria bacterium]